MYFREIKPFFKLKFRCVILMGTGVLILPYVLFAIGWLKMVYAVVFCILMACLYALIVKRILPNQLYAEVSLGGILGMSAFALLITYLSGSGGYFRKV